MMWWTTLRSVGRTSAICTHLSSVKPVGTITYLYSTVPDSGTLYGSGNWKTRSGFGMDQPWVQFTAGGRSFWSPSGAPALAQAMMVWMSASLSARLLEKCPYFGSANQGGICFCCTASFIAVAHGFVSANVSIENGAASPGRWHDWQFFCRIGATS